MADRGSEVQAKRRSTLDPIGRHHLDREHLESNLSVDSRSIVGRQSVDGSVDSRSTVGRLSTDRGLKYT